MTILNLTQHIATPDQKAAGVVDFTEKDRKTLQALLTFTNLPEKVGIIERAKKIKLLADTTDFCSVMIGGAPYLMCPLEKALQDYGIFYAYSKRECVEISQEDGSVKKTFVFKHEGFIEV